MKIYVIVGTCGEWSDREEWVVCAYSDEAKAIEHASLAKAEAERIASLPPAEVFYHAKPDAAALKLDANMRLDYTGTDYTVVETELRQ